MLEAVRVRREGFAYRPFFSCFFNMYRPIAYYFTDQVTTVTFDVVQNSVLSEIGRGRGGVVCYLG